jgi:ferrochelatase
MTRPKIAIVLFNLGGPDSPAAIRPFLLNLFSDPAILRLPFLLRPLLARIIARARVKPATANYALLGGRSPLLEQTQLQAAALSAALPELDARCFIAMRYWHPFSRATVRAVLAWRPDEVALLPLYPQYSSTTTASSLTDWREAAAAAGLVAPVRTLCCFYDEAAYIAATAALLLRCYEQARASLPASVGLRVLFSAHGLPERIIAAGDPYQLQVERTVAAVRRRLALPELDAVICYQSRATPQSWIGPATEAEVARAGRDRVAVLIVPIAFVSEHVETLVELDIEYRRLAGRLGVPGYFRVPTQGTDPAFIAALAGLVRRLRQRPPGVTSCAETGACPPAHHNCPLVRAGVPVAATIGSSRAA